MSAPRRIYLPEASNDRLDRLKAEGHNLTLGDVVSRALALYEHLGVERCGLEWHVRDSRDRALVIRVGKRPAVAVML